MLTEVLNDLIVIRSDTIKKRIQEAEEEINRCVKMEPLQFCHPGFGGFVAIRRHLDDVLALSHEIFILDLIKKELESE